MIPSSIVAQDGKRLMVFCGPLAAAWNRSPVRAAAWKIVRPALRQEGRPS